jgi:hypothetical protein
MDKTKEEGRDINLITRTMTWVRTRSVMGVEERDAGAVSGRTQNNGNHLLPVVVGLGRAAGCDVESQRGLSLKGEMG